MLTKIKYFLLSAISVFIWCYLGDLALTLSLILSGMGGCMVILVVEYLEYKSYMSFLKHCKDCIFIIPTNPEDGSESEIPENVIAYHVPQHLIKKKKAKIIRDLVRSGNPFWTDPDLEEGEILPVVDIYFRKGVRVNHDFEKDHTPFVIDRIKDCRSNWHRVLEKNPDWYRENWLERI